MQSIKKSKIVFIPLLIYRVWLLQHLTYTKYHPKRSLTWIMLQTNLKNYQQTKVEGT